jgi:hypothetical protein
MGCAADVGDATVIPRKTPLKRGQPPKPVNRKRRASEFARCYGSRARVAWIKNRPCIACGEFEPFVIIDNAHSVGGGAGRKSGYETVVPLCRQHHQDYDQHRGAFSFTRDWVIAASFNVQREWLAVSSSTGTQE